jgi:hypothetical protein
MAILDVVTAVSGNRSPAPFQPLTFLFNAAQLGLSALKPPDRVVLDTVTIDATLREEHSTEVDVTEHPVEDGANITDHIRPQLKVLQIDGIISNTPVGLTGPVADALGIAGLATGVTLPTGLISGAIDLFKTGGVLNRAQAAFQQLQALADKAVPFTIHTPLRDYAKMAMKSLSVVRDPTIGDGIRFVAVCKEIRTVDSLIATSLLPDSAQPTKDLGSQSPSAASAKVSTPSVSLLKSATNALGLTTSKFRPKGD